MDKKMTNQEKAIAIYNEFTTADIFFRNLNLPRDIKRCVNFEAGNQWNTDNDIEGFPKIVLNIIKQIKKVRIGTILQNEYGYLVNSNNVKSVRKIQDFLKHLSNKLKLKSKDVKALNDDYTKGAGINYFYWDAEKRDFLSKSGGALKSEMIDIRRFRVADPYVQDIQEQEWVMFVSRERVSALKAKYGVDVAPDSNVYTSDTEKEPVEIDNSREYANVYTKFYRNSDGEVLFTISTQTELLKDATFLNPTLNKVEGETNKAQAESTLSTNDAEKQEEKKEPAFGMYPFAVLVLNERDNCFYGIPAALESIEAQKSINQHFSVYDKALQDNVLGGFVMKRGVLGDQAITTDNGQVIELDMLPSERIADIFGRIPVNQVPNDALNYSGTLLGVVKQVESVSNVQTGQADYSGQSGKQTQLLLDRAKENSTDVAAIFNEFKQQQAMIMFLFSKFYYDNEEFTVIEHGFKKDISREYKGKEKFNGNEYLEDDVFIDVRVGPAPSFSEYSATELLGMMVQSGQMPPEVYLMNLPDGVFNNKQELIELINNNQQTKINALTQQLEQAQKVMQQMSDAFKKTQKDMNNIDTVVAENQRLRSMLAQLASSIVKMDGASTEVNNKLTQEITNLLNAFNSQGKPGSTN